MLESTDTSPRTPVARSIQPRAVEHQIAGRNPNLAALVQRLVAPHRPDRVHLLCSRGRGEGGPGSDYDLLMVFEHLEGPVCRISQEVHAQVWGLGTLADPIALSRPDFERRLPMRSHLPVEVRP